MTWVLSQQCSTLQELEVKDVPQLFFLMESTNVSEQCCLVNGRKRIHDAEETVRYSAIRQTEYSQPVMSISAYLGLRGHDR